MPNDIFSSSENTWVGQERPLEFKGGQGFLFFKTSGSQSNPKWVAYNKKKFLKAAESANQFLEVTDKDVWLDVLPSNHVASLSISARSYVAGFKIIEHRSKWSPEEFIEKAQEATISSLVPTQVYDLIEKKLCAPKNLRFILVGGGSLSIDLYKKARELGWPLLPTYGMSEAGSQVATANLETISQTDYPRLSFLSHIKASINTEGFLILKSDYLFEGYYNENSYKIEPSDKVLKTSDKAILKKNQLISVQRESSTKKVLGVLVDKNEVERRFLSLASDLTHQIVILFAKDNRAENTLILVSDSGDCIKVSVGVQAYNQSVEGPFRISKIYHLEQIPRTKMGKIELPKIIEEIGLL